MAEPEDIDEDLFADLYEGDAAPAERPTTLTQESSTVETLKDVGGSPSQNDPDGPVQSIEPASATYSQQDHAPASHDAYLDNAPSQSVEADQMDVRSNNTYGDALPHHDANAIGIKEDGKMFIGGLNWETTDQSLKDYFSQFGEVAECTVMRDSATGRSRGFGFLTFRDPKTVNTVMVKEHFLDNKIIDPKRAIPRDEQERTSKIFVGGVSQEATEQDFKQYFMQYGRVIDATLMMDKDTGRPRGFGFVTFDSEAAVDATLNGDLMILGKPIEVKKAQPRGNMREDEERDRRGRRGGRDDRFRDDHHGHGNQGQMQNPQALANGMSPQMAAQYWQRMQQFMAQFMAAAQNGAMANAGMAGANPAMMQQMQQMQAMQQMQKAQMSQASGNQPGPGGQGGAAVNPQMMQQMQMAMATGQQQPQGNGNFAGQIGANVPTGPAGPAVGQGAGGAGPRGRRGTPGFNAQDQMMFEQRKYEQQQARRVGQQDNRYHQGGPTSWEGMYDDVPQPSANGPGGGSGRGGPHGGQHRGGAGGGGNKGTPTPAPQAAPPANAPTGPKNAGVPGANYRGGRGGGRGGHRGNFHPYHRRG